MVRYMEELIIEKLRLNDLNTVLSFYSNIIPVKQDYDACLNKYKKIMYDDNYNILVAKINDTVVGTLTGIIFDSIGFGGYDFMVLDYLRSIYSEEELEIKRCGSFGKNKNSKKIFECNAGSGSVVLTPDLKVYPCLFFTKPGYEIGYYKDGSIYIDNSFAHDSSECNAILKLNKKR